VRGHQLLANPDLAVVGAICASAGADQTQTLETLVQILDAYKLILPIIYIGITKEVSETGTAPLAPSALESTALTHNNTR
jgi:hypothetical protein